MKRGRVIHAELCSRQPSNKAILTEENLVKDSYKGYTKPQEKNL